MNSDFRITSFHWLLTLSVAIILHLLIVINFHQDNQVADNKSEDNNQIVISLKKFKAVRAIEITEPVVQKKKPVEQPKAEIVKTKKQKPKVNKKPVTRVKKTPPVKPNIEPILEQKPSIATASKPIRKPNVANKVTDNSSNTNRHKAEEKQRYLSQLSLWLNKHKKYPTIARRRKLEGNLTISFVIDRNGHLLRHSIVEPSAHKSLNAAAVKMLERASPMPAIPNALIENRTEFQFSIPVNFKLSQR